MLVADKAQHEKHPTVDIDVLNNDGIFRDGLTDKSKSTQNNKTHRRHHVLKHKMNKNEQFFNNPSDASYNDYEYGRKQHATPTKTRHKLSKFFHTPIQPSHTSNSKSLNNNNKPSFFYNPFFDPNISKHNRY